MANNGHVKTRKAMTVETVTQLLNKLNERSFKNCFQIEYCEGDENSYGPHMWFITYEPWGSRVFWLNDDKSFEVRHSGATDFIWWADSLILAVVADQFDGRIFDDGVSGSWPGEPDKIDTYPKYLKSKWGLTVANQAIQSFILEATPPEFCDEVKAIIKL